MSEFTSQCYLLTPSGIYCVYPQLFLANKCIRLRHDIFPSVTPYMPFSYFGFGLHMQSIMFSHRHNTVPIPCLENCPVLWNSSVQAAHTNTVSSISGIRWGGIKGKLDRGVTVYIGDGFEEDDEYLWRIDGGSCYNPNCPNFRRISDLTGRI